MKRMMYSLILMVSILLSVSGALAQDDEDNNGSLTSEPKFEFIQNTSRQDIQPSAGNSIYQVFVDETQSIGAYTAATGSEHPVTLATGSRENILFGGTSPIAGTSFNTIRSYSSGTDYAQSANVNTPFELVPFNVVINPDIAQYITIETIGTTGHRTIYDLPGPPATPDSMRIVQEINVIGTTFSDTRIEISVSVTNTGNTPLNIGIRYLWDFQLQGDESPLYQPMEPALPLPTVESAFSPPAFGMLRISTETNPSLFVHATVNSPENFNPTPPDELRITRWSNPFGQAFNFIVDPTGSLGGVDTAISYFFGETEDTALNIAPGATTTVSQSLYATSTSQNTPPVAVEDAYNTPGDQSATFNVLVNDFDLDNDILGVVEVSAPASGGGIRVTPDGQILYSPPPEFVGEDLFTYAISDGRGGTSSTTVEVMVMPPNQPPVANNDEVTVPGNTTSDIDVLENDTDPENDPIIVETVQTTARGARVVIDFPSYDILYTPPAGFIGEDSFLYTIVDSSGGRDTAQVIVTVTDPNNAPIANADTAGTIEGQLVTVNVLGNDSDPDGDPLTVTNVINISGGTAILNADNTVTFTPTPGFIGSINPAFTYIISDGGTGTAQATVTINVNPSNRPPIAVDDNAVTTVNIPVDINVLANDADEDGNPLSVSTLTTPSSGTAVVTGSGTVLYTPMTNFVGVATFEYTVNDGNGGTDVGLVTVTVNESICEPGTAGYNPTVDLHHEQSLLLPESNFTTGRIVNHSTVCGYAVGMASYFMLDNVIDNQIILDYREAIILPGQTLDLTVEVPTCARQIDLFHGNVLLSLDGQRYSDRLIEAVVLDVPAFCTPTTSENP